MRFTRVPRPTLKELLRTLDAEDLPERPFPTDGWSGAAFSAIDRGGDRLVLKRTSPARDWIVRATGDSRIREAWFADRLTLPDVFIDRGAIRLPYLGTATDGDDTVLVMPDLSAELIAWDRPEHDPVVDRQTLKRVLDAVARLHSLPWSTTLERFLPREDPPDGPPWCPLPERLLLLSRPAAQRYAAEGNRVGERFLDGWACFDRHAPSAARDLVDRLAADVTPLVDALSALPRVGLHGDLKLANVALLPDGEVGFIDWQLTLRAPIAVELGWLLVSNSGSLPDVPEAVFDAYLESLAWNSDRWTVDAEPAHVEGRAGDVDVQRDLAWIVGLMLRAWRKGLDTKAGVRLPSGWTAGEDLAWWSARAADAAERRL
jgi:hypothetical protein